MKIIIFDGKNKNNRQEVENEWAAIKEALLSAQGTYTPPETQDKSS